MDAETLKGQLINSYLNQQLTAVGGGSDDGGDYDGSNGGTSHAVQAIEMPDNALLEAFKNQVRLWTDIDNQIVKLQQAVRERNAVKKQLTEKIIQFMGKYNIGDLNIRDGSKLRYNVSTVKPPVSKADIKARLTEYYGKAQNLEQLTELIFKNQDAVKKVSLRRLRNGTNRDSGQ